MLLKKVPPQSRRLLVIGTTSAANVMQDMGVSSAFNFVLHVPCLREPEVKLVLAAMKTFQPHEVMLPNVIIVLCSLSLCCPSSCLLQQYWPIIWTSIPQLQCSWSCEQYAEISSQPASHAVYPVPGMQRLSQASKEFGRQMLSRAVHYQKRLERGLKAWAFKIEAGSHIDDIIMPFCTGKA